jgi:hypothetical protein
VSGIATTTWSTRFASCVRRTTYQSSGRLLTSARTLPGSLVLPMRAWMIASTIMRPHVGQTIRR